MSAQEQYDLCCKVEKNHSVHGIIQHLLEGFVPQVNRRMILSF